MAPPANGWGLHVRQWDWEFATGKDMKEDINLPKNKGCKRKVPDHLLENKTWAQQHKEAKTSLEGSWGPNGGQRTVGLILKIVGVGGELMDTSAKKATDIQTHF